MSVSYTFLFNNPKSRYTGIYLSGTDIQFQIGMEISRYGKTYRITSLGPLEVDTSTVRQNVFIEDIDNLPHHNKEN